MHNSFAILSANYIRPPSGREVAFSRENDGRSQRLYRISLVKEQTTCLYTRGLPPPCRLRHLSPLPPEGRIRGDSNINFQTDQTLGSHYARLLLSREMLMAPSCKRSRLSSDLPVPIATQDTASLATRVLIPVTCSTSWSKP